MTMHAWAFVGDDHILGGYAGIKVTSGAITKVGPPSKDGRPCAYIYTNPCDAKDGAMGTWACKLEVLGVYALNGEVVIADTVKVLWVEDASGVLDTFNEEVEHRILTQEKHQLRRDSWAAIHPCYAFLDNLIDDPDDLLGGWTPEAACKRWAASRNAARQYAWKLELAEQARILTGMLEDLAWRSKARSAIPRFEDARGVIEHHALAGTKYNVLHSKAGTYRSGDVHPAEQYDSVLSGMVVVTTRHGGGDWKQTALAGDRVMIPSGVPHLFYFEEDTVMVEWWSGPFKAKYYKPYRDIVEESLAKAESDAVAVEDNEDA